MSIEWVEQWGHAGYIKYRWPYPANTIIFIVCPYNLTALALADIRNPVTLGNVVVCWNPHLYDFDVLIPVSEVLSVSTALDSRRNNSTSKAPNRHWLGFNDSCRQRIVGNDYG